MRCMNTARRRALSGSASGNGTRPASCASESAKGSSSSANGLPPASASSRARTDDASGRAPRFSNAAADR